MEDNEKRTANKTDTDQAPAKDGEPVKPQSAVPVTPPSPIQGPPIAQGNTENPEGHQANGQSTPSIENKKRIDTSAVWMIVLTGIIAVATGLNVYIFYLDSEDTGKQIGNLATKAEGIVTSMNTSLSDNREAVSKAFDANKAAVEAANLQNQKSVAATLKSAQNNLAMAQQSLEVQERPWITETAQISESIIFNVNGVNITFLFTLDNIGHSPADKVWIEGKLINTIVSGMPSIEEHNRVCSGPITGTSPKTFTLGETLFPGKPDPWAWTWTIPWSEIKGSRAANVLGPLLYGCIEYNYGLSSKRHSTPFRYEVFQSDGRLLVQDGGFNISTKDITPSMLRLRRNGIIGQPTPN